MKGRRNKFFRSPSKSKAGKRTYVKRGDRGRHEYLKMQQPDRLTGIERRLARDNRKRQSPHCLEMGRKARRDKVRRKWDGHHRKIERGNHGKRGKHRSGRNA